MNVSKESRCLTHFHHFIFFVLKCVLNMQKTRKYTKINLPLVSTLEINAFGVSTQDGLLLRLLRLAGAVRQNLTLL